MGRFGPEFPALPIRRSCVKPSLRTKSIGAKVSEEEFATVTAGD
jgi:hypothetical protein